MKIQYKPSTKDSRFLEPVGDGSIDVLDMAWTLSPKSSRVEVPYARLVEYQQTTGQLIASIIYYGRVASGVLQNGPAALVQPTRDPFEVYKYKYFAEPTGFSYRFPYFNPKKLSRGNSFSDAQGSNPFHSSYQLGRNMLAFPGSKGTVEGIFEGIGKAGSLLGGIRDMANTLIPGKIAFETPHSWDGTDIESYSISFDLFNTQSEEETENNRNLCHLLSYQNSPSRRNFAIIDPPVIYSLTIPDVVHMPACWMSGLEITNLGNTRSITTTNTGIPRVIPEAYRIQMTFTSLLMPTRNILLALDKGQTVEAISDIQPFMEDIEVLRNTLIRNEGTPNEKQQVADSLDRLTGYTGSDRYAPGSYNRDLVEFGP